MSKSFAVLVIICACVVLYYLLQMELIEHNNKVAVYYIADLEIFTVLIGIRIDSCINDIILACRRIDLLTENTVFAGKVKCY